MVQVTSSSTMNLGFGTADPIMYKSSLCKEVMLGLGSLGTHVLICKEVIYVYITKVEVLGFLVLSLNS